MRIKDLGMMAGLLIGGTTLGCDDAPPSVDECRPIVEQADAEAAKQLEAEKEATHQAALAVAGAKAQEELTPEQNHDKIMEQAMEQARDISRPELALTAMNAIQFQINTGINPLHTTENLNELQISLILIIDTHPEIIATSSFYGLDDDNKLFGINPIERAINNVGLVPFARVILDPQKANGDSYDHLAFYNLKRVLDGEKEAGLATDIAQLQALADAFIRAHAEKGLNPQEANGDSYDDLAFYNLKKVLDEAKEAGLNTNIAPLQTLADAFILAHKEKAPNNDLHWKELKNTAQEAGFTVNE